MCNRALYMNAQQSEVTVLNNLGFHRHLTAKCFYQDYGEIGRFFSDHNLS